MKIVIDIDENLYTRLFDNGVDNYDDAVDMAKAIRKGTPLSKYMDELKRRLFMDVDGGTDDRYLRYTDVCDRISNTIETYIRAERSE
jgi:hypothetical protein